MTLVCCLQYIYDSNPNHNDDRSRFVLYRSQTFNFPVFKLRSLINAMQLTFGVDILGSETESKTNVPLYFSMLKHAGLLPLSKHSPIWWVTVGGTELDVNHEPEVSNQLSFHFNVGRDEWTLTIGHAL